MIVVGASVRAIAMSAWRAGSRPWCVDRFADRDLQSLAPTRLLPAADYPHGLPALLADAPKDEPIRWTGGLENHPDVLERLAQLRPMLGISPAIVRACRQPWCVAQWLQESDYPALEVSREPPTSGRYLSKPLASAGGIGIQFANGVPHPHHYYQRYIEGISLAAIYRGAQLCGITRQLHEGFHYAGSVGPWPVSPSVEAELQRLGSILFAHGLDELYGVDLILAEGVPYVVEINPRYTASVEILEWSRGQSLLGDTHGPAQGIIGKRILYARKPGQFPDAGPWDAMPNFAPWQVPAYADIPAAGTRFDTGEPIMTVYATGASGAAVLEQLQRIEATTIRFWDG